MQPTILYWILDSLIYKNVRRNNIQDFKCPVNLEKLRTLDRSCSYQN